MKQKKPGSLVEMTEEHFQNLARWQSAAFELAELKQREIELREKLTKSFFPSPQEGVNRVEFIRDGLTFEIVANFPMSRKLDEAAINPIFSQLPETSVARELGKVVRYVPELVAGGFKDLPEEERKIVSQCLTEKLGTPSLSFNEITPAHNPATAPAVPDFPAVPPMPLPETIEVNGIHYAPHPIRTELPSWVEHVKNNPPPGTVSFEVSEVVGKGYRVIWNGVPVDPQTGEACQKVDFPVMEAYLRQKEQDIAKAKAFIENGPPLPTPEPVKPKGKPGRKPGSKNKPKVSIA